MIVGDQFIKASFSSVDFFLYSIRAEQKKPRWVGFLVNVMGESNEILRLLLHANIVWTSLPLFPYPSPPSTHVYNPCVIELFLNGSQTHVGSVLVANLELVQLLIDLQSLVSLFYIYVTLCLVRGFMKLQGFFSHCIHLELGLVVTLWQKHFDD